MLRHDEGLEGALLAIASDSDRIHLLHRVLDRYCHRFRNRLNSMKLTLYLTRRSRIGPHTSWSELEAKYQCVEQFIDQLQNVCRPFELKPIEASLGHFLEERRMAWERTLSARGRLLEFVPPETPAIGQFDPSRLAQGCDALATWRSQCGTRGSRVRVRWWRRNGRLHLNWEEPGVTLFDEPGPTRDRPTNLTLPMLARIMCAHRGTMEISWRDGLCVNLNWPSHLS